MSVLFLCVLAMTVAITWGVPQHARSHGHRRRLRVRELGVRDRHAVPGQRRGADDAGYPVDDRLRDRGRVAHQFGAPDLLIPMWLLLFGLLGWNFLEYGLFNGDIVWGWLVCGVLFEAMAFPALLILLPWGNDGPKQLNPRPEGAARWWAAYVVLGVTGAALGWGHLHRLVVTGNLPPRGGVDRSTERRTPNLNTGPEDAEILARVRGGDRDAYAELVRRHAPVAMRTAALLGAGGDAEDVVQEAFVKAYAALDRFRPGAPFRPWLLRIVANETRNLHRVRGPPRRRGNAGRGSSPSRCSSPGRTTRPTPRCRRSGRTALVRGLAQLSAAAPPGRDLPLPARPRRGRDRRGPRLAARHGEVPAAPGAGPAPGRAGRRAEPSRDEGGDARWLRTAYDDLVRDLAALGRGDRRRRRRRR